MIAISPRGGNREKKPRFHEKIRAVESLDKQLSKKNVRQRRTQRPPNKRADEKADNHQPSNLVDQVVVVMFIGSFHRTYHGVVVTFLCFFRHNNLPREKK